MLWLCVSVSLVDCDRKSLSGPRFPHLSDERVPCVSEVRDGDDVCLCSEAVEWHQLSCRVPLTLLKVMAVIH